MILIFMYIDEELKDQKLERHLFGKIHMQKHFKNMQMIYLLHEIDILKTLMLNKDWI